MATKQDKNIQSAADRRAYQPPRLVVYGELRALTQAGSQTPNENNSAGGGCPSTGSPDYARKLNPNC